MKKYYKANLGGGVRSIIADTTTGRISLFYPLELMILILLCTGQG